MKQWSSLTFIKCLWYWKNIAFPCDRKFKQVKNCVQQFLEDMFKGKLGYFGYKMNLNRDGQYYK